MDMEPVFVAEPCRTQTGELRVEDESDRLQTSKQGSRLGIAEQMTFQSF
jgi:hypothetical protein